MSAAILADLGNLSLVAALALSLYSAITSSVAACRSSSLFWSTAVRALDVAAVLLTVAVGLQAAALVSNAFQLAYVASNSSRELPLIYAVAALWSGDKGSLILWAWAIGLCSAIAARQSVEPRLLRTAVAVGSGVQVLFVALVVNARPFALLPFAPLNGQGLNPSLQTPWMFLHPLPLYLAYAAFTFPFAFALAALIAGRTQADWARASRRWAVVAWSLLTVAMIFGSQWAARERGWGGFWGWDPVENAALLPWLSGAALIHSIMVTERRSMLRVWSLLLACITFAVVLIGAFISRGGVVPSIHAFGASAGAVVFLQIALAVQLFFICLLVMRFRALRSGSPRSAISRESTVGITNAVLILLTVVVLSTTLAPWLTKLVQGRELVPSPSFYGRVTAPLWATLVMLMGVCPLAGYGATASRRTLGAFALPAILGLGSGVFGQVATSDLVFSAASSLAIFAVAATVTDFQRGLSARMRNVESNPLVALAKVVSRARRHYGGYTVHIGTLLAGFGMMMKVPFAEEAIWVGLALIGVGVSIALYPEPTARAIQSQVASAEGVARSVQPITGGSE